MHQNGTDQKIRNIHKSKTKPKLNLSKSFPAFSRSRGIASGIAAALYYLLGFIAKKTYYDMEVSMSLPGITLFFCIISLIGLILSFFILPETENRTLEEIELHFTDNSKKITDWRIAKLTAAELNSEKNDKNNFGFDNKGYETECSKVWLSLSSLLGTFFTKVKCDAIVLHK